MCLWLVVHHLIACFASFVTGSHFESPLRHQSASFSSHASVFEFFAEALAKSRAEAAGVLLSMLRLQFTGNITAHSTTLLLHSCQQYTSNCSEKDQSAIF